MREVKRKRETKEIEREGEQKIARERESERHREEAEEAREARKFRYLAG